MAPPRTVWQPTLCGDFARIPLTRGQEAIIDATDVSLIEAHRWRACPWARGYYAKAAKFDANGRSTIQMHRVIMAAPNGMLVDHIDGNTLNNRRENLRLCNSRINQLNRVKDVPATSRFRGVHWKNSERRWIATVKAEDGRRIHLGGFPTEELAAQAYDDAARSLHQIARLNFARPGELSATSLKPGHILSQGGEG